MIERPGDLGDTALLERMQRQTFRRFRDAFGEQRKLGFEGPRLSAGA